MQPLRNYLQESFPIAMATYLVASLALGLGLYKKKRELLPIIIYLAVYLAVQAILCIHFNFDLTHSETHRKYHYLRGIEDTVFTIYEFYVFQYFIKKILTKPNLLTLSKWTFYSFGGIVFPLLIFSFIRYSQITNETLHFIFMLEASLLLTGCVSYYIELFSAPPVVNILDSPPFWIITGIGFCMLCTIPVTLFLNYFLHRDFMLYKQLFIIFDICYCLLFCMFIRAFLCLQKTR